MVLVWLPPGTPRDELGAVPATVQLGELPQEGGLPPEAARVELLVLAPQQRDRLRQVLPALTGLRVVQTLNAGVDWVPQLPAGVLLCNASGVHDGPVADWVLAVLLAHAKRLPTLLQAQREGRWDSSANLAFGSGPAADDLAEMSVLIVGHGSIGRALQARLEPLGSRTVRVARTARTTADGIVHGPTALPGLVPGADVVVLLAPATPQTAGLVDAGFLASMRHGALLINAARGPLVDTAALLRALQEGRVRAALDSTDPEPLPTGHPLWSAPGCLITPHVAGSSAHWRRRAHALVGDQLRRLAAGEPLVNQRAHGY